MLQTFNRKLIKIMFFLTVYYSLCIDFKTGKEDKFEFLNSNC